MSKKALKPPKNHWHHAKPTQDCGVLVFVDEEQERFLPWWTHHYRAYNHYPITFIDFGMSEKARSFCKEHGELVPIDFDPDYFLSPKETFPEKTQKLWELRYRKRIWKHRAKWYLKPFALQKTPYQNTLYLDIDTQVRICLSELFEKQIDFGCVKDPTECICTATQKDLVDEPLYNGGVLLYRHKSPIVDLFVQKTLQKHRDFPTDQDLLSKALLESKLPFTLLDRKYNALAVEWIPPDACILHWACLKGKASIEMMSALLFQGRDPFTHQPLQ